MHWARLLFVRYCIFTTASLTGLVIGADTDRLQGAVWGLVVGAAISLATMISFYRFAVARLGPSGSGPASPGAQRVSATADA
jgi:O-antigen/teichoic acid export membrane protein